MQYLLMMNVASTLLCGIDEVGRGCWAGPLVVGAVILQQPMIGLNDSKQLSKKVRAQLAAEIWKRAEFASLGWVGAQEVDQLGLTGATTLACLRAIEGVHAECQIIIDGSINYLPDSLGVQTMINADETVQAVSAASIIAKVARDQFMQKQALIYADYGFEHHVGYGTAKHKAALARYGLTPLHRRSYKPVQVFYET